MDCDDGEFGPHLAAIRASVLAGFRFLRLPEYGDVLALYAFREDRGAMDTYLARGPDDATAARYRLDDLDRVDPPALWHRHGCVADVVTALLELPPHGFALAPRIATVPPSQLWTPRMAWS